MQVHAVHIVCGGHWTTFKVTSILSPWVLEISKHLYLLGHAAGSATHCFVFVHFHLFFDLICLIFCLH